MIETRMKFWVLIHIHGSAVTDRREVVIGFERYIVTLMVAM
jgi:hypothetical protein